MVNKIDSNVTGLAIAEETLGSPGTLPGTPVWYAQEPNGYSDFGGQVSTVSRAPINPSRQRNKGTPTDFDASGGFGQDFTQNNFLRLLQGFMFADAREQFSTDPLNGTKITITGATSTTYTAASGLNGFRANDIAFASGFTNAANNGKKVLSAAASGSVTTTGNVAEASPPAAAKLEKVGHQFASGDATMTVASGVATLGTTTKDLTQLELAVGQWVFIGGDAAGEKFATCPVGYARVKSVATNAIVFDKVSAAFVSDTGTGKTIQIFFGKFIRNEETPALIKTRTYQLERQLGNDGGGIQSEYLKGAVANEFAMNIPLADKLVADVSFVAMDQEFRTGATGIKSGTRVAALGEGAYNTSSKIYRIKMNIIDNATLQPTPLYGYVTEASLGINNGASIAKAVGKLGGIDVIVGDFVVNGNVTAYFTDTAAVSAIRNSADVTFDLIAAQANAGFVFDLPLLTLGNGRINVTKDQAITLPVSMDAAKGTMGYTAGYTNFAYLPNSAMPV